MHLFCHSVYYFERERIYRMQIMCAIRLLLMCALYYRWIGFVERNEKEHYQELNHWHSKVNCV